MFSLEVNQIYKIVQHQPLQGADDAFRVLRIDQPRQIVWLISLPRKGEPYCASPFSVSLEMLDEKLRRQEIVNFPISVNPIWLWGDDEIRRRYPGKGKSEDQCSCLERRDRLWSWIEPFFIGSRSDPLLDALDPSVRAPWLAHRAKEVGVGRTALTNAFNTYLASGCIKNSLIPQWSNSGGPGIERTQVRKLGRPDARVAIDEDKGYPLSEVDKQKLAFGWNQFYRGETSMRDAYLLTCGVFYSEGSRLHDGHLIPIILPDRQRPTENQFRTWGPQKSSGESSWRRKISDRDFHNNYRGLPGRSTDLSAGAGSIAFCDTTTNDCQLRSSADPLKPIGTLNRLMIIEGTLGIVVGVHCSLEAPSGRTFLQAVANAASPKKPIYARYGIDISENEALTKMFPIYIGDNGEYRSQYVMDAISHLGGLIEYARSGGASSKGC